MAVIIRCPNPTCGRTGNVPAALAGKAVRCPACRTKFRVPAGPDGATPADAAQTGAVEAQATMEGFTPVAASLESSETGRPSPMNLPAAPPARIGRFEVRALLGTGAFGAVYRAYDPQLDREVALKVPRADALNSPQRVERFLREAKAAARLQHPHIVPVYEAGSDGTHHYIASALIDGHPLSQAAAESPFDFRAAARVVRDLADALAYVHGMGVVHRDVKPANVLLDKKGRPFLTDFGLAHLESNTERVTRLTRLGSIMGTPAYMAPEQAAGHSGVTQPASDQYSLGVILYELLCGRTPFEGPPQIVLFNALNTAPLPPRQVNAAVPAELEAICLRAMAKRAEERYGDCQGLVEALDQWLGTLKSAAADNSPAGVPTAPTAAAAEGRSPVAEAPGTPAAFSAAPPGDEAPLLLWCQQHPGTLVSGVAALILTLLVTLVLLQLRASPPAAREQATIQDPPRKQEENPPVKPPPKEEPPQPEPKKGGPVVKDPGPKKEEDKPPAKIPSEEKPRPKDEPPKLAPTLVNTIGMKLVLIPRGKFRMGSPRLIPRGKFRMGSPETEEGRGTNEDEHEVEITQPFYMGAYEVTQAQYRQVMGNSPSNFSAAGGGKDTVAGKDTSDFPVETVSWEDAVEFCKRLSGLAAEQKAGQVYGLPTEAEWEYTCRGGPVSSTPFHFGNSLSSAQANFHGEYPYGGAAKGRYLGRTEKVGSYPANRFGLYDMHGNVWEWCQDWYDKDYYRNSSAKDPQGPNSSPEGRRVLRGGSWFNDGVYCRSAQRWGPVPGDRDATLGFRVVFRLGVRTP